MKNIPQYISKKEKSEWDPVFERLGLHTAVKLTLEMENPVVFYVFERKGFFYAYAGSEGKTKKPMVHQMPLPDVFMILKALVNRGKVEIPEELMFAIGKQAAVQDI